MNDRPVIPPDRDFWERVFMDAMWWQITGTTDSAKIADDALAEWRQRWGEKGSA